MMKKKSNLNDEKFGVMIAKTSKNWNI